MRQAWSPDKSQARLWTLLKPCGEVGLSYDAICAALPDLKRDYISCNLGILKRAGYTETFASTTPHMWRVVAGSPVPKIKGAEVAQAARPAAAAEGKAEGPTLNYGDVAAKAGALLGKHPAGLDSDALAKAIGVHAAEVDAALLPAVMAHVLTTCSLLRAGRQLVHYRLSAGPVMQYGWREQTLATWSNRKAEMVAELNRRGAPVTPPPPAPPAPPAAPRAPSPATAPKPAPAPVAQREVKPEVASEVLDAAPPPPPQPRVGVPFVGELDIDAVYRNQPKLAGVSAEEKAALLEAIDTERPQAAAEVREAADFICALYSTGDLLIESGNAKVTLPLQHTRKLLHYLDHLRGDELVESVLGELH